MLHGFHSYQTSSNMDTETTCAYPTSNHSFPHCKCVFICCTNYPRIDLLSKEWYKHNSKTWPTVSFYFYHFIAPCTVPGRLPLDKKNIFYFCLCVLVSMPPGKLYTTRACYDGDINFWLSDKFLRSRNAKNSVSSATWTHYRYT